MPSRKKIQPITPFFVAIAGNIGVGKTTLTLRIADRFEWQAYYERVIDNPYLEDFYSDMKRWSFHLQVYFLSRRFKDQKTITEAGRNCVQDRTIYEDAEIFARILHDQQYMNDRDFDNYRELFDTMTSYLRKPDLILYLRASTWTLITRIRKRGRDYEKNITSEYLHVLNQAYDRWISQARNDFNVLTIDADNLDFDQDPQVLEEIYRQIDRYRAGAV
ncbi:deoxynucleoside kinase [candidate division KSB1 bacterium]|nr:deoxynucleoside kinase [candidate division KSB1 bacterium]